MQIPKNFPRPRKNSVIVKQVTQGTLTTESGIQLIEGIGKNVNKPNVGVIYAIGAACPDDIKVGDRVYYNQYSDLEILVGGFPYVMFHEQEIFCILEDDNRVSIAVKPAKETRLIEKMGKQEDAFKRDFAIKANQKDRKEEIAKKLIKKR